VVELAEAPTDAPAAAPPADGTLEAQLAELTEPAVDPVTEAPETEAPAASTAVAEAPAQAPEAEAAPLAVAAAVAAVRPAKRKAQPIFDDAVVVAEADSTEQEVITRISTSGGRHWGITVGRFPSRAEAERALLKTQLAESATLNDSLRKVVQKGGKFDANFMGLSQDQADLACRRLAARAVPCFTMGP
jgi:D-alanyl-D-alanine carboxypeptidase